MSNWICTSPPEMTFRTSPLAPVLDPSPARLTVLVDQRHAVALTDAVVDAWDLDFGVAKFAALERDGSGRGR